MAKYIKEKKNYETLPEPITLKGTEKIIDQMNNSICRIYNDKRKGTGFFIKIPYKSQSLSVLITSNHIINKDDILNNKNISIYINNDKNIKTIKLDSNRKIYSNEKFDITIIEIKENEDKLNNKYLELDDAIINYFQLEKNKGLNYLNNIYSNESIYILNYPKDNDIIVSYGKLFCLKKTELFYKCNIKENSSGSPILLTNNQKLIGIHSNCSKKYKYNKGSLLIYLIKEFSIIKNNLLLINKKGEYIINNYIIGEFDIKENNQKTRIINSYEQSNREVKFDIFYKKENENEKEIKDNCEIRINDELIPFSYFYNFIKKGIYKIKYTFILNNKKINYLFSRCSSLTNINFTNFNTNNVINMCWLFSGCSSLKIINLTNFNTNRVTNMSNMFSNCSSITNLDLSNFDTNNVTKLSYMFRGCSSLQNINISNFNTNNVSDMSHMFSNCFSITNLDLSNFDTNNASNLSYMFNKCKALTKIDLSNFTSDNVKDMSNIFNGCQKLTKNNIIAYDNKILEQL